MVRAGRPPHPLKLREQNPTPKPAWTGVRRASGDTHLPMHPTNDPRVLLQSQHVVKMTSGTCHIHMARQMADGPELA